MKKKLKYVKPWSHIFKAKPLMNQRAGTRPDIDGSRR